MNHNTTGNTGEGRELPAPFTIREEPDAGGPGAALWAAEPVPEPVPVPENVTRSGESKSQMDELTQAARAVELGAAQARAEAGLAVNRAARIAAQQRGGPVESVERLLRAGAARPRVAGYELRPFSLGIYQLIQRWATLPVLRPDGADLVLLFLSPVEALDWMEEPAVWEREALRVALRAGEGELAAALQWIDGEREAFFASPAPGTGAERNPESLRQQGPGGAGRAGGSATSTKWQSTGLVGM